MLDWLPGMLFMDSWPVVDKCRGHTHLPIVHAGSIMIGWNAEPAFIGKYQMVQAEENAMVDTSTLDRSSSDEHDDAEEPPANF